MYDSVQISMVYQPLQPNGNQPFFMHYFINAFFRPRSYVNRPNVWTYELPSFLNTSPSRALICSIRAATMAHYGKQTGDHAMQLEACRWYDKGLESQRLENQQMELQLSKGGNVDERINEATLCAPIMFSLFESLMTTSFNAWSEHMKAAGKMLEMRGPENCRDGIIHHIFRTVRLTAVSLSLDVFVVHANSAQSGVHLNSVRTSLSVRIETMVYNTVRAKSETTLRRTRRYSSPNPRPFHPS